MSIRRNIRRAGEEDNSIINLQLSYSILNNVAELLLNCIIRSLYSTFGSSVVAVGRVAKHSSEALVQTVGSIFACLACTSSGISLYRRAEAAERYKHGIV